MVRVGLPVVAALVLVAAALSLPGAFSGPEFVDEVTVVNPTAYTVRVRVQGSGGAWLRLGNVQGGEERVFESVIDQGDRWRFAFSYAGHEAGDIEVSRDVLEARGWRVEVPAGAGRALARAGITPPPPGF